MPREKIRRTEKTSDVDMKVVNQLIDLRDSINQKAKQTGLFCNLFPDINKKVCQECPGIKSDQKKCEFCFDHVVERTFIHNHDELKGQKRRERKQDNPKKGVDISETADFDTEDYGYVCDCDDYGGDEIENCDETAKKYPCGSMYFACPNNAGCEYGKKCTYPPES